MALRQSSVLPDQVFKNQLWPVVACRENTFDAFSEWNVRLQIFPALWRGAWVLNTGASKFRNELHFQHVKIQPIRRKKTDSACTGIIPNWLPWAARHINETWHQNLIVSLNTLASKTAVLLFQKQLLIWRGLNIRTKERYLTLNCSIIHSGRYRWW